MARSSRIGRGQVVVSCWTASGVFCCTIVPCLILNHGSFQHSQLVLLSVAVSSCIYLCVFHRLKFRASDVSFAPSPAVGAPVVVAASAVAAFFLLFSAVCRRYLFSKESGLRGLTMSVAVAIQYLGGARMWCFLPGLVDVDTARAPTEVAFESDMLTRIWPPRLDHVRCGSNPISGRSPHVVE